MGVRRFAADLDLYLEDDKGIVLATSDTTGADGDDRDHWEHISTTLEAGRYYLRVQAKDPAETTATNYILRLGPSTGA